MKVLPRIIVVASLVGMFLPGSAPDRAQAIQPEESQNQVLYLPYVNNSYYPVTVLYAGIYISKYRNLDSIMGEIINNSHKTVYQARIIADVFDNEVVTQTYTTTTMLPATFPGGTNPFQIGVGDLFVDLYDFPEIAVRIESYNFDNAPEYLPLTVVSKIIIGSNLTGEIRNDTLDTIQDITVVSSGCFWGFGGATVITPTLAPGETTNYTSCFMYFPGQDGESYSVWAQGAVAP